MPKVVKQPHGGELHVLQKGETANPNGRPRKVVTTAIKELKGAGYEKVSRSQVVDAFEILLCLDEEKLTEIVNDKKQPMLFRITAKNLLSERGFTIIKDLLDRVHGRPAQQVDVTTGGDKVEGFKGFTFLEPLGLKPGPAPGESSNDE